MQYHSMQIYMIMVIKRQYNIYLIYFISFFLDEDLAAKRQAFDSVDKRALYLVGRKRRDLMGTDNIRN